MAALAALQEAVGVAAESDAERQPEERDVLHEWDLDEEDDAALLPGKELVKRMSNVRACVCVVFWRGGGGGGGGGEGETSPGFT